ncbi:jg15485 [Pararge aegeria aegeria]|uniref:Jg15485 protein n=1 Tax=Pararge aegeria aegeria TaxID=348720 RepID=A0A8S4R782_9NEOP|nr:jg15485 [Pararge aegeria aegeria]
MRFTESGHKSPSLSARWRERCPESVYVIKSEMQKSVEELELPTRARNELSGHQASHREPLVTNNPGL